MLRSFGRGLTCRNTSQHGGQTHVACCAQQCWDMLLECCDRLAGALCCSFTTYACSAATMLSPSQTIATCHGNTSQHCWAQHFVCIWPGHRVAICCNMLGVVGSSFKMVKFEPTTPNMSQHGGQTRAKCCVQQCCDMLCWHVAIVWPGLYRVTELK